MSILDKKQMTEEDIKLNYITPALLSKGWKDKITMETKVQFTDGKINLRGNLVSRESPKKADYILFLNKNYPIAVVEAKDNNHSVSLGMQQAKVYAQMLDVPFAYSSNGDAFQEFDFLTGIEREIAIDSFPTPDELFARYQSEINGGQGLSETEFALINQPYYQPCDSVRRQSADFLQYGCESSDRCKVRRERRNSCRTRRLSRHNNRQNKEKLA